MNFGQCCFVVLLYLQIIQSQNYDIVLEKMYCENLSNHICQNATCRIRPVKRFVANLTFECDLREEIDSALFRIKLYYKLNEYRQFLIDVEEDLCDYFVDIKRTKVLNLILPALLPKSNINYTCPLNEGRVWIRNLQVDVRTFPPFAPSGQYRLDIHATNKIKTKVYLSPKVYFSVRPKGIYKGEMG